MVTRRGLLHLGCGWLLCLCLACGGQPAAVGNERSQLETPVLSPAAGSAFAQIPRPDRGQIIYVPVYSHIYYQDQQRVINLNVTLSVRNTDGAHPIQLDAVQYYDSQGSLVRTYVTEAVSLNPLASTHFVVEEDDTAGGVGASFIVAWRSDVPTTPPLVEAVMISAASAQGISFVTSGRVLEEYPAPGAE
ncbi:MAG: DUF3124 domain-containing protein [Caldilineaceae bacterium]